MSLSVIARRWGRPFRNALVTGLGATEGNFAVTSRGGGRPDEEQYCWSYRGSGRVSLGIRGLEISCIWRSLGRSPRNIAGVLTGCGWQIGSLTVVVTSRVACRQLETFASFRYYSGPTVRAAVIDDTSRCQCSESLSSSRLGA